MTLDANERQARLAYAQSLDSLRDHIATVRETHKTLEGLAEVECIVESLLSDIEDSLLERRI